MRFVLRIRVPCPGLVRGLLIVALAVLLQACDAELYTGLSEREATVMVATLARHGIPAKRVAEDEGRMTVTVDKDRFAEAVEVLDRLGLPQERFTNLGEVFQNNSLVSSPVQERAQMIYALSEELSHTVSQVDGVPHYKPCLWTFSTKSRELRLTSCRGSVLP